MLALVAICLIASFAITALATPIVRRYAPQCGLIDLPDPRKVHTVPTARGGGIAIWMGVMLPLLLGASAIWWVPESWWHGFPAEWAALRAGARLQTVKLGAVLLGGTAISLLGLVDDIRPLRWQPKLIVQILVAVGLVACGVRVTLFSENMLFGAALSVVWILVLTNAFNFLDNMDALCAGIALIVSSLCAVIMLAGTHEPRWFIAALFLVIAGSAAGFLCHNRPPARIFMGDTGSCLLGLLTAAGTIMGTFHDYRVTPAFTILAPLCILAVPLYDFTSVMIIRLAQGRSPFHADKSHFSHRLVDLGMNRVQAVLTIHLVTLTTGLGGLLLYQVQTWGAAMIVVMMVALWLVIVAVLEVASQEAVAARKSHRLANPAEALPTETGRAETCPAESQEG